MTFTGTCQTVIPSFVSVFIPPLFAADIMTPVAVVSSLFSIEPVGFIWSVRSVISAPFTGSVYLVHLLSLVNPG